jgi:arylsulfatase A-like enzyme
MNNANKTPTRDSVTKALGRHAEAFRLDVIVSGVALTSKKEHRSDIQRDQGEAGRLLRAAGYDATAFGCTTYVSAVPERDPAMWWLPEARVS